MAAALPTTRVYDSPAPDGFHILVDRMWPRGVRKDSAAVDAWVKDVAPSTELRRWFNHDPEKFDDFARRYRCELDANPEAVHELQQLLRDHPGAVLTHAAKSDYNNAVVLAQYLAGGQQ